MVKKWDYKKYSFWKLRIPDPDGSCFKIIYFSLVYAIYKGPTICALYILCILRAKCIFILHFIFNRVRNGKNRKKQRRKNDMKNRPKKKKLNEIHCCLPIVLYDFVIVIHSMKFILLFILFSPNSFQSKPFFASNRGKWKQNRVECTRDSICLRSPHGLIYAYKM